MAAGESEMNAAVGCNTVVPNICGLNFILSKALKVSKENETVLDIFV